MQYCQRVGSQSVDRCIFPTEQVRPVFITTDEYYVPPYIDAPLSAATDEWLSDFAHRPSSDIDFDELNAIIPTGSANIGSSPTDEFGRGQFILEAREAFFSAPTGLDLANQTNPLYQTVKSYRATRHWPPIMTFVRSQRFQYANNLNGAHNIKTAKGIFGISAEDAALSFAALVKEGGNPAEIAQKSGGFLELSGRNIHETVGLLREKGLDVTEALSRNPAVLGRSTAGLASRIDIVSGILKLLPVKTPAQVLLSESSQWLSVGDKKLRVLARVLSRHTIPGAIPEEPARIRKIALLPLESVLSSIIQEGTFTTAAAERESLRRPIANRACKLNEQLLHEANLTLLGEKTVRAYIAYAEKTSMAEAMKITRHMFETAAAHSLVYRKAKAP